MFEPEVDVELGRALGGELAERLNEIGDGGTAELTDGARKLGLDWYEKGEADRWKKLHPVIQPWCERRLDHAIKLGYLNSLLEGDSGPLAVDEEGLTWGLEAVEWLTPRIQEAFLKMDETKYGELHRVMLTMISRNNREIREQTLRKGLGNKYSVTQVDEGIRHLIVSGAAIRKEKSDERGKTGWWICAIERDNEGGG